MNLVLFNGSPRKKTSNSKILIEKFLKGYNTKIDKEISLYYIMDKVENKEKGLSAFQKADTVLIFFPLYADSMPGIVKEFFEEVATLENKKPKKIGFVVQSGFAESHHSIYLERYLKKLTKRLGYDYLGTVIKGGVEGIRMMPDWMTRKLFLAFEKLGQYFALNETFSPIIVKKLAKPYKKSLFSRFLFRIFKKIGFADFYWNTQLKKYQSFDKRFDTPYSK
jgi:NAD(P)H-dependent FMN reductase